MPSRASRRTTRPCTRIERSSGTAPNTVLEWWAARSGFPPAWDRSHGGGARVAVIDSGIDVKHPDLAGRVTVSKSFDPDHPDPVADELGHGTHVASLACGTANNGVGLAGAGFGCSILNAKTSFADSEVAKAIVWATDERADVINMSFGADPGSRKSEIVGDALDRAERRNVVLVAAAADVPATDQGHPANLVQQDGTGPDLDEGLGITVTVANFSDAPAAAGHGSQISMAAYGAYDGQLGPPGIFGAFPEARTGFENGDQMLGRLPCNCRSAFAGDQRYGYLEGTSMASAMVSGAAALVRSLNPDLSAREVVRLLKRTARQPGGTGWRPELGWGILDANAALNQASTLDRRAPTSEVVDVPARRPSGKLRPGYRWRDRAPDGVTPADVRRVDIYVRVDRRPWRRVASVVPGRRAPQIPLQAGHRYAFVTSAVDRMNNRERRPKRPDQTVVVGP